MDIQRFIYPAGETELWELLETEKKFAIDTETNGLRPYHGDRVWGISLYFPIANVSFYIPVRYAEGSNIAPKSYAKLLRKIERADLLIGFNLKFDLHMLMQDGMKEPRQIEEVMIAAHLLNENEYISNNDQIAGAYKLKRLARKYLGPEAVEGENDLIEAAKELGVNPKTEMWKLPANRVAFYAMKDTEITWQLREFYRPGLERWSQWELYQTKNKVLLKVIFRMERNGMRVDVPLIHQHIKEIEPKTKALQEEFNVSLGLRGLNFSQKKDDPNRINLNSPMQVKAMFQAMGHNIENTDKLTMRDLSLAGNPIATKLLEYREQAKAASTYYEPYLLFVDADSIIHHSLNITGTKTRRLSSQEPNFQNIPKAGKLLVKQVFVPRPGYALLQFDYKALELRLGAHFAGEKVMREMLNAGTDLHQYTADVLGVSRSVAKTYNFGLSYGMGYKKASRTYGIALKEALRGVEGWHSQYPGFRQALARYERLARTWRDIDGKVGGKFQYVRLANGVVRHYNEYSYEARYEGEYRGAWNFVVQGTAAVVAETAALRVSEAFPDNHLVKPVNAVHDSLMVEVRYDKVDEVVPVIKELMEDFPQFNPRLEVDVEITTKSWYEMDKYKPGEWQNGVR